MADHISVEQLADAAEGLLEPERALLVRTHLESCPVCLETADLLTSVTVTLAAEPHPVMPADVVARLDAVIAAEQSSRSAGARVVRDLHPSSPAGGDVLAWTPRPRLAPAPPHSGKHRSRSAGLILAAAAAAMLVGFGGYVVSARAGLNEPPSGAAAVSSGSLRTQAGALKRSGDVDPHRFSQAWWCARRVTAGRITGIASVTVDGTPALLVYLRSDAETQVAVVEGCHDDAPRVTATRSLTR